MQKLCWVLVAVLGVGIAACKKKDEAAATAGDTKPTEAAAPQVPLTPEAIADVLSKAVCERMVACDQNAAISVAECSSGMAKDLAQALPEKAKAVAKDVLDKCVASIAAATCESLNSPTPPAGCEFME